MTTPAMKCPLPSMMPEAVRNSVSIRSEITGARAGMTDLSSSGVATRQFSAGCARRDAGVMERARAEQKSRFRRRRRVESVKVNDASLQRGGGGLGAIADAELAEQAVDMRLHRRLRNEESRSNLFIAVSADNEAEHLRLAVGERRGVHALGEALGNRSGNAG